MSEARQDALTVFKQSITKNKAEIAAAMPRNVPGYAYDQVFASAVLAARKSEGLCAPEAFPSLFLALLDVVRLGLHPHWGPAAEAVLIPYGSKVQLVIGAQGYRKLMLRAGTVRMLEAFTVYKSDEWDFWQDEHGKHYLHRPAYAPNEVEKLDGVRHWFARADTDHGFALTLRTMEKFLKVRAGVFAKIKDTKYKTKAQAEAESAYGQWPVEMGLKGPIRDMAKVFPSYDVEAAQEAEDRTEREVFGSREPSKAPTTRAQEVRGPAVASDSGAEVSETPGERVAAERTAAAPAARQVAPAQDRVAAAAAYIGDCEVKGVLWDRQELNAFGLGAVELNTLNDAMNACRAAHEAAQKRRETVPGSDK